MLITSLFDHLPVLVHITGRIGTTRHPSVFSVAIGVVMRARMELEERLLRCFSHLSFVVVPSSVHKSGGVSVEIAFPLAATIDCYDLFDKTITIFVVCYLLCVI
ncbi:hypothetical protein Dimus_006325 [Dionaea muscipula]